MFQRGSHSALTGPCKTPLNQAYWNNLDYVLKKDLHLHLISQRHRNMPEKKPQLVKKRKKGWLKPNNTKTMIMEIKTKAEEHRGWNK